MKFLNRSSNSSNPLRCRNTTIGVGSSFRGTLMVSGTLHIDGEVEGDILNCERLEIGEHGVMRADIEVKDALIEGRMCTETFARSESSSSGAGSRLEGDISPSAS